MIIVNLYFLRFVLNATNEYLYLTNNTRCCILNEIEEVVKFVFYFAHISEINNTLSQFLIYSSVCIFISHILVKSIISLANFPR